MWGYHHSDAVAFRASVEQRCVFCARLAEKLGPLQPWFDHQDQPRALYRWTIRQTPRIRETKSHVSVIFRPVPGRVSGDMRSEDLPEVRFELFPEENLGYIPKASSFGMSTESEPAQEQMRAWLADCLANHPKCARRHASRDFIPTRVLDVGLSSEPWPPSYVRVVETTKEPIAGPYATLSHCWGRERFVTLGDENVEEFTTTGVPWALIRSNDNFVDAILTTRRLGVRYLWIDSLCIVQQQKHGEDWEAEAPLMHQVYRNSFVNLAATESHDRSGGLFRDRDPVDVVPAQLLPVADNARFGWESAWRVLPSDLWDRDLLGSHLYTRGWVFQERMLSPRLLQFTKSQIFWDCAALSACEALPAGLPPPLDARAASDRHWRERLQGSGMTVRSLVGGAGDSLEAFWRAAVRSYTSCALTNHDDKIKAAWGVAKLVRDALGEEYAAGLWTNAVEEQLAWRVLDRKGAKRAPESGRERFPRWSWAAVVGEVDLPNRVPDVPRFYSVRGHDGRDVGFRFEKALWGWVGREAAASWGEEFEDMNRRLGEAELRMNKRRRGAGIEPIPEEEPDVAPVEKARHPSNFASKLVAQEIAVQGHICSGTLQAVPGEDRWVVVVDGLDQEGAVIEAYPDIQPTKDGVSVKVLLLAASRLFVDEWDDEYVDRDYLEYDEIADVKYSGTGILIEDAGNSRFARFGAVRFGQLRREGWRQLRRACGIGEEEEECEDGLEVEDGQKIWLV
ncbi:heterokaryon incompatibility protein [Colletotrichum sojae]|uniref:Heterokaryon incompatibility protein n=1 Tax=Colletotrichum sojae TaxID=2175907 RepID=A0A8H6J3S4_9PEZI|nr:heterokaryon incompatibility protein [Colletotrichum sojae]